MDQAPGQAILLVDDSVDDRFFSLRALKALGVAACVRVAGDATEALDRLATGGFALVLLDWHLPGDEGADVLARVRGAVDPDVIVIVLSGRDDEEVQAQALAGGARGVLRKPLDAEALRVLLPPSLASLAGNAPA